MRAGWRGDRFLFLGAGAAGDRHRRGCCAGSWPLRAPPPTRWAGPGHDGSQGGLVTGRAGLADDQRPFAVDPRVVHAGGVGPRRIHGSASRRRGAADRPHRHDRLPRGVLGGTRPPGGAATAGRRSCCRSRIPTTRAEARPPTSSRWTDGRALVATGSQPTDVALSGRRAGDRPSQQRVHLSGRRPGGDRGRGPRDHRRDLPGRGSRACHPRVGRSPCRRRHVPARRRPSAGSPGRLPSPWSGTCGTRASAASIGTRRSGPAVDRAMWWPDYPAFAAAPNGGPFDPRASGATASVSKKAG